MEIMQDRTDYESFCKNCGSNIRCARYELQVSFWFRRLIAHCPTCNHWNDNKRKTLLVFKVVEKTTNVY